MNKKVFIFYFKRGYCDTVCYCHMLWSSWSAPGFSFSPTFQSAPFFLSAHTDSWKALPFILYSRFFSMMFTNWHVYVSHCTNSHRHGDVRSPVEVLPEGLSFILLRKSHWTRASMNPACITPVISHPMCVCDCVCVQFRVFVKEKNLSVCSYFLQIIKAQVQSPHPSFSWFKYRYIR